MEIGAMLDELREMALKDEKIQQELLGYQEGCTSAGCFLQ